MTWQLFFEYSINKKLFNSQSLKAIGFNNRFLYCPLELPLGAVATSVNGTVVLDLGISHTRVPDAVFGVMFSMIAHHG